MKKLRLVSILCFVLFLVSCIGKSEDSIVTVKHEGSILGKWEELTENKEKEIFEFLKDGTFIAKHGKKSMVGEYVFTDKERVRIDFKGNRGTSSKIFVIEFSRNTLIMTNEGEKFKYKRIQ